MTALDQQSATTSIDPATEMGVVALSVANLDRSLAFYTDAMGFAVLQRTGTGAVLGVAGSPLLVLTEQRGALPWLTDGMTGLYHFAILVPTRAALGRWLRHYLSLSFPPPGQGDHIVSEALYLRDPDGHGIEVYRDRPREGWRWTNGQVQMGAGPVDLRGILAEAGDTGQPWAGLAAGTKVGHVHLQVGDIPEAAAFYHGVLGFDIVAQMPSALFVSAGGYHHHLGMNTWHSQGAAPASGDTARLLWYTIALPSEEARAAVVGRLTAAGIAHEQRDGIVTGRDPWQNAILLHVGPLPDALAAAALADRSR